MSSSPEVQRTAVQRPIIFSTAMVRAVRMGKHKTRRVVRFDPCSGYIVEPGGRRRWHRDDPAAVAGCPYGCPGDQLWVRETWQAWRRTSWEHDEWEPLTRDGRGGLPWSAWRELYGEPDSIEYRATSISQGPWTPAIHMPRWASRTLLDVKTIGLERLQQITDEEAIAEGVASREEFFALWDLLNGSRVGAAVKDNPYVWVVGFDRCESQATGVSSRR